MVRTILRNGSRDLLSDVRRADRTGIIAASAPPSLPEPDEPGAADIRPVAAFGPGSAGAMVRRIRRQASFACAAVGLVALGWIGGGTFAGGDVQPAPAIAAGSTGVLVNDDQSDVPDPPAPEVSPAVPTTTSSPSVPPTASRKQGTARKTTDQSVRPSRSDPAGTPTEVNAVSPAGLPRTDTMFDDVAAMLDTLAGRFTQLQWVLDTWNQADRRQADRRF